MKKFNYLAFQGIKDAENRYITVCTYLKNYYNVDFVANYDLLSLHNNFKAIGAGDFHSYKKILYDHGPTGYFPDIRGNGEYLVLCIGFSEISQHFDGSFSQVTGENLLRGDIVHNKGNFYDEKLKLVMCFNEEHKENLKEIYVQQQAQKKEWAFFHDEVKPKMSPLRLGEKFPIGFTVADHFLNCMPPIYGNNCFLMGEPCSHTKEGETIYYCIRGFKWGKNCSPTIEFNTVKNCKA